MTEMIMHLQKLGVLIAGEQVGNRRSNIYVQKDFQKSFILFFALVILVLIIATGAVLYIFLGNIIEQNIYTIHPKVDNLSKAITPELVNFFLAVTTAAVVIIIIAVDRLLNSVAKSLMVYERISERLAKLDFAKAKYLEPNRFFSLKHKYDGLMAKYGGDILKLRREARQMKQLIELMDEGTDITEEKRNALIRELGMLKEVMDATMREYTLGRGEK